jgi:hypothetical protein
MERGICDATTGRASHNVLAGLRRPKRSRAERLAAGANGGRALSDDEIRNVWQAAGSLGSFGGLVRLALLTDLRRGETRPAKSPPRFSGVGDYRSPRTLLATWLSACIRWK